MILKSIELCNFRNYKREIFKFHPGTNVLYGDNAQGKTNVLEAIFVGELQNPIVEAKMPK